MIEIKNPHKYFVDKLKYFFDDLNKRDWLLSYYDLNIKLWNINTLETLFSLTFFRAIDSACFLNENKNIYIAIKVDNIPILIYDLEGNIIKKIKDIVDDAKGFDDVIFFSDSYYDKELNKSFIIMGKKGYSKSYDYTEA